MDEKFIPIEAKAEHREVPLSAQKNWKVEMTENTSHKPHIMDEKFIPIGAKAK